MSLWQCQAVGGGGGGSQFYWSAICGTNSFATHPSCLMDSQIPGMSWHPVATNSTRHFNWSSEKFTLTANIINMPKPVQKLKPTVQKVMRGEKGAFKYTAPCCSVVYFALWFIQIYSSNTFVLNKNENRILFSVWWCCNMQVLAFVMFCSGEHVLYVIGCQDTNPDWD